MSDTPRTDAAWSSGFDPVVVSAAELARRLRERCAELERENAALRSLIDDPNAMHSHYLRECNGWEVWQAERIHWFQETVDNLERENAELRKDKERLDWLTTQNRVDYSISYWRKTDTKTLRAALDAARKEGQP